MLHAAKCNWIVLHNVQTQTQVVVEKILDSSKKCVTHGMALNVRSDWQNEWSHINHSFIIHLKQTHFPLSQIMDDAHKLSKYAI